MILLPKEFMCRPKLIALTPPPTNNLADDRQLASTSGLVQEPDAILSRVGAAFDLFPERHQASSIRVLCPRGICVSNGADNVACRAL